MTRPAAPAWVRDRLQRLAARLDRCGPLPPPWARWQAGVARRVLRLPSTPPSMVVALALNRVLWHRLPEDLQRALQGRVQVLEVTDLGWRIRLRGGLAGFVAAGDAAEASLRIAASASGWWRLARGLDDPDRLFFERVLVMEGDTELGLLLKNTLDALGPLWPVAPGEGQPGFPSSRARVSTGQ